LALFYDLDYSTWNLLDFLDPNYYFAPRSIPAIFLETAEPTSVSIDAKARDGLSERLGLYEIGNREIDYVIKVLSDFQRAADRFQRAFLDFYEAEEGLQILYGFQYTISKAVELLSITLTVKLLLRPVTNKLQDSKRSSHKS